jgi:hypothetical protein
VSILELFNGSLDQLDEEFNGVSPASRQTQCAAPSTGFQPSSKPSVVVKTEPGVRNENIQPSNRPFSPSAFLAPDESAHKSARLEEDMISPFKYSRNISGDEGSSELQRMVDGLTLKLSWDSGSEEPSAHLDDVDGMVGQGELSSIARQIHQKAVQRALYAPETFKEPCRTGASSDQVQLYLSQLNQPQSPGRSADPSVDVSELLRLSECGENGMMGFQASQLSLHLPSQTAIYG